MPSPKNGGGEPTSGRGFQDVDRLKNTDGIVAVISQRSFDGQLTVAVFREFERDGKDCRTSFIPESLTQSFREMFERGVRRMAELKVTGTLPFPVGGTLRRR
jgi:hypothetical protein